jgi:ribosomal protein L40E
MTPAPQKCPSCGAMSSGKFCSECGAPLGAASCAKCGAKVPPRAKFCGECGAPVGGGVRAPVPGAQPLPRSDRMAWYVAGVAVLALLVVVVVIVAKRSGAAPGTEAAAPATGPVRATTDLSSLTPRQSADMLFNKIMTLHEAGKTDSVNFFAPMALQAYAMLGSDLDADARLHLGLIELAIGQPDPAAAQGDTILRKAPQHLFGWLLEARAAEEANDTAAMRRSLRTFLRNYQAERAKNLPEYGEHAQMLQETRDQAERLVGSTGGK